MSDNFDIPSAVRLWSNSRNGLFDFAEMLASADDADVQEVARKVKRSPSLLYGYRKAGEFWLEIEAEFPQADVWRDHLEIGYWTPLARLWKNGTLELPRCVDMLIDAMDEGWTVEEFRAKLPVDGGNNTGMPRKLWHVVNYVKGKIKDQESYGLNCSTARYKEVIGNLITAIEDVESLLMDAK